MIKFELDTFLVSGPCRERIDNHCCYLCGAPTEVPSIFPFEFCFECKKGYIVINKWIPQSFSYKLQPLTPREICEMVAKHLSKENKKERVYILRNHLGYLFVRTNQQIAALRRTPGRIQSNYNVVASYWDSKCQTYGNKYTMYF